MQEPHTMTFNASTPSALPSELVEHWEWTRVLARRMVRDPNDAEDAAQEAWALARSSGAGAAGRSVHAGFFGAILRNVVRSGARAQRHREARQGEVVRRRVIHGQEGAAPDELVAAAETGRRLCAAVLDLPDAYRDVVLQRYFQGLAIAEMAARGGEPEGTLRSRLKRALDQLREGFDDDRSGAAGSSLACLAALPFPVPASPGVGQISRGPSVRTWGSGYGGLMAVGVSAAVILLVLAFALGGAAALPAPPVPVLHTGGGELGPLELDLGAAPVADRVALGQEPAATTAPKPFEVTGRILDSDRKPLQGVELTLQCRGVQGEPQKWITGADGAFRLRSPWRRGGGGGLKVNGGDSHASRTFRFGGTGVGVNRFPRSGERDLGDIVLGPRGRLVGRLVDGDGEPLPGVELWLAHSTGGTGQMVVSGDGGAIVFGGLREGGYVLQGMDNRFEEVPLTEVFANVGKVTALGDVTMSDRKKDEDIEPMDFLVFDHNETDTDGERAPLPGPVFKGHVLRDGQPVAALDVTASPLIGRNGSGEFVALGDVPVDQWLGRVDELMVLRPPVIRARTDAHGRFVLRGVIPGTPYRVVAWGKDDHAVLQPAIAVVDDPTGGSTLDTVPVDVPTPLGALELVPYASVSLTINGPANIDGFEYELRRTELDEYHIVGADRAGTFQMEHVICGPHIQWIDAVGGRLAVGARVEFDAKPGAKYALELDATGFALTEVSVSAVDQGGRSPGYRARLLESGRDDAPMVMGEVVAWDLAHVRRTVLTAKAGAWDANGLLRARGVKQIEIEIAGRRIRREFLGLPRSAGGAPMVAAIPFDGGAELQVTLPESVEFLERGKLEFLGPRTSWSALVQDGELVGLPWQVRSPKSSSLLVGALDPVGGEFQIRVTDLGIAAEIAADGSSSAEDEEGLILFEAKRQVSFKGSRQVAWRLR